MTDAVPRRFRATELPAAERAPVIAAYRARWDSEVKKLARLPDSADHPVFRITTAEEGSA